MAARLYLFGMIFTSTAIATIGTYELKNLPKNTTNEELTKKTDKVVELALYNGLLWPIGLPIMIIFTLGGIHNDKTNIKS